MKRLTVLVAAAAFADEVQEQIRSRDRADLAGWIVAHPAVRAHAVAVGDQGRTEPRDRAERPA